jgi:hypothetical protein
VLLLGKQRVSSSGNQKVFLLGKQRVPEESRTDSISIPNASDLLTNIGHISKWDQARESELTKILMSKSIRYCYQDTSYADPDKGIHMQFHNGLQFDLTDFKTQLQHPELIRVGEKVMIRVGGKVMKNDHPTTSYAGPDLTKSVHRQMDTAPQISFPWNSKRDAYKDRAQCSQRSGTSSTRQVCSSSLLDDIHNWN